jgi:hypothetical protein
MSRSSRSALRITARATVSAALGLALVGAAAAPALAEETGVITKPFGKGYPTEGACDDAGQNAMAREHADDYTCYRQPNNKWDGYLKWYT